MRAETGKALLATSPQMHGGPALSSLVSRVASARGLAVATTPSSAPLVGLGAAPPLGHSDRAAQHPAPGLSLLGAHGGAGVSSLLRAGLDRIAVDAERHWPSGGAVVMVARTSTSGLEWAGELSRQHATGLAGDGVELLGLVLIADAPGRLPRRTCGLRELVAGAFGRTWHLPWLEEWRLAASSDLLPVHPNVAHLLDELARTPVLSHPHLSRTNRTPRT